MDTNLKKRIEEVEQIVYQYLPKEEGYQKTVLEAMNYTMTAGGKRIRPLMMYETYQMFGGNTEVVHPFMAALEMIHTYSLIHDDLPALDNDDYRRGRPTAHKKFNEAMAILAGDGLLNYAFEVAAGAFTEDYANANVAKALQVLTRKPGIYGMIGGQVADVELTGTKLSDDQLAFIYKNKTGALIEAAMMIGGILAGATDEEVAILEQIAAKVGLAFQIQDDILDMVGEQEKLGKPIHSDEKNEKVTYVTLYGLEQSRKKVEDLSGEAVQLLHSFGKNCDALQYLITWLIHRDL